MTRVARRRLASGRRGRICVAALVGAGALALPAGASGAQATLDRACYVSGQEGTLSLSGFAPSALVTLIATDLDPTQVTTDAAGSLVVPFVPPSGNDIEPPASRSFGVTATEVANPLSTGTATSRVAPFAFSTDTGLKSPDAVRTWHFSGFIPGRPIYAHFRFKGVTRGTFRFGVAKGPCGEYRRRAPLIAVAGRAAPGSWTVQVDQSKRYAASNRPRLTDTVPVLVTRVR